MPITAFYAGLLAFVFVVLSFRTIGARRAAKVEIGDGSDRELLRRMRVHANFAEYVPIALILMALAETMKPTPLLLHVIGIALLGGRIVHAYALSQSPHILPLRVAGMVATLTAIMAAAATCLALAGPALY
jgi:uncharacterized membrane protein YecN with MAPEG domain